MKFFLVVIFCFGLDCQAIYETTSYPTYNSCLDVAQSTSQYLQQMYPQSSGEAWCYTEDEYTQFLKFLEEGNVPSLSPRLPENQISA